jgi:hypothetical protein
MSISLQGHTPFLPPGPLLRILHLPISSGAGNQALNIKAFGNITIQTIAVGNINIIYIKF